MVRGTVFSVFLPVVDAGSDRAAPSAAAPGLLRGNSELILVVDDEQPIRQVVLRGLTHSGYRVPPASDGRRGHRGFLRPLEGNSVGPDRF